MRLSSKHYITSSQICYTLCRNNYIIVLNLLKLLESVCYLKPWELLAGQRLQTVSTLSSCSHFKALVPQRGPPLFTCHRVFKWKQVSRSICPVPPFYIFILLCSPDGFSLQIELFFAPRLLFKCLTALCRACLSREEWRELLLLMLTVVLSGSVFIMCSPQRWICL